MLITAWGMTTLWRRNRLGRIAVLAGLVVAFWPLTTVDENNALFAVLELRSQENPTVSPRELYLERTLPLYGNEQRINRTLPIDAKVLLFQEIRGAYLDRDYQWGDPVDQGLIRYRDLPDAAALLDQLQRFHITHVLRNARNPRYLEDAHYYDRHALRLMDDFLNHYAVALWETDGVQVYELHPSQVPHAF